MAHKKFFLLAALLALSMGSLLAQTHSKKTYLALRPQGVNVAMEKTTWHEHAYTKHAPTIRTHLQATPFYQQSQLSGDLGTYFGIGNGKNSFTVGAATAPAAEIDGNFLIHDQSHIPSGLAGTVSFSPEQELYGMRLDLFQDVNHPFAKVFVKASAPFVHVQNTMRMKVTDAQNAQVQVLAAPVQTSEFSLENFFNGNVSVTTAGSTNIQSPLTRAKITGSRSQMGIADVDVSLGYKFLYRDKKHCFASIDLTIPTGNKTDGVYLFEPIYGNGQHVGLGLSLDSGIQVWHARKSRLDVLWTLRYKYLFQNTEARTLGIKDVKLGHYFMAGVPKQKAAALFPAANELTRGVCVKPGSLFDTMIDLSFNSSNFTIDMGYSLFWKDNERVRVNSFADGKLALAKANYSTAKDFVTAEQLKAINAADLDIEAATTPSLLTHKLSGGLGYTTSMYQKYRATVGLGASYEVGTTNADVENYALWAKAAFSF